VGVDADAVVVSSRSVSLGEQVAYLVLNASVASSSASGPTVETFEVVADVNAWKAVRFTKTFVSPIVVCTPVLEYCTACARFAP
jgi:hypothetical protein